MLTTEWEIRELLTAVILLLLGWMAYRSSGEKAALVSMMVITGMKGVSVRKVFRTGLVIWTGCFVITVLLALIGTIEPLMLVHNKAGLGYVIRNSLGYTHPNVLHISYVILLAFWFYTFQWTGKKLLKTVGIAFLGNLYIFAYSLSYTGFALTVFYLVLLVYISFRKKRTKGTTPFVLRHSSLSGNLARAGCRHGFLRGVGQTVGGDQHRLGQQLAPGLFVGAH